MGTSTLGYATSTQILVSGQAEITGAVIANSTLKVGGVSTLAGVTASRLNVTGPAEFAAGITVVNKSSFGAVDTDALTVKGALTAKISLVVESGKPTTLGGDVLAASLAVTGGLTANSTLKVVGAATLSGGVTASGLDVIGPAPTTESVA